jgi:4-hydroxyphenylacetate 3-monooxygenase
MVAEFLLSHCKVGCPTNDPANVNEECCMFSFEATVLTDRKSINKRIAVKRMYNLGSATRDASVAVHHQEEVARVGVKIALHIPAPRIYPIDTFALTTEDVIGVHGLRSSGEVEIVLVMSDRLYVGVGSDHTDRDLERGSIVWSKQVNPNILAPTLWDFEEIAEHWDQCLMRSRVDGRPYQNVGVNAFLSPLDILKILKDRVPGLPERDFVVFCSTIVALDKEIGFGQRWEFEIEDPVLGRMITHTYKVEQLLDEIAEPYRVPLVTGKL